jgi:hypothetical protein
MSWNWQQQNNELTNKIQRKTEWKSPNTVSQNLLNNIDIYATNKTDPINLDELNQDITNGITTLNDRKQNFYINPNDNIPYKSLWNDLNNIKTITNNKYNYATLLSINTTNENSINSSPLISCRNFNFNIPTGSTITGLEIKITKSAYSENKVSTFHDECVDSNFYNDELFIKNITNYTFDDVIMISLSGDCELINDNQFSAQRDIFNETPVNNLINFVPQYTFLSSYKNYANSWIKDNWINSNSILNFDIYNYLGFESSPRILYENYSNNYEIILPKGIWEKDKLTQIYGGKNNLWGDESLSLTPNKINSSDFGMYFKCIQKIPRSYSGDYLNEHIFSNNNEKKLWYENILDQKSFNCCEGYEVSKLYDIQIRIHYEINSTTYTIDGRDNIFNSGNTLKIDDIYFKYQKCFNGICYQYINDISNIYDISLLTGDNISINNMYNEYNIIDKYYSNIYKVDIATKNEINLSNIHYNIDNIKLIPEQYILLLNQTNEIENDIYKVDENYFLQNSNLLSTRECAYKAKIYIKLGTYKEKQYFLNDFGNQFPITGESKIFTSGHSYIIKNYIDYNIKNTEIENIYDISGNTIKNPNKIIFTNYKVARTLSEVKNWNDIEFIPSSAITINYLNTNYTLTSEYDIIYYDMSGSTTNPTYFTYSGLSYFSIDSNFYTQSSINDHSLISLKKNNDSFSDLEMIPENSYFNYLSQIRYIDSNYVAFNELPTYIINDMLSGSTSYNFRIRNLHYCSASTDSYEDYLKYSPYSDILNIKKISGLNMIPYNSQELDKSDNWRYFDFNSLTINNIVNNQTTAYTFKSDNQYQNYKLKPFLDNLGVTPNNVYNETYYLSGEYIVKEIWENIEYNRDGKLHSSGGTGSYYTIQSSRLKIIPNNPIKLKKFKAFTYIDIGILTKDIIGDVILPYNFSGSSSSIIGEAIIGESILGINENNSYDRTLILEITDEYMIIEKPRLNNLDFTELSYNFDFITVNKTQDISDLLYDLYLNYEHSYYYHYTENIYNKICSAYAIIIKNNKSIRNMTSGILYQKNDLFNFDIFDINIDKNYNHLNDVNLTYKPIELIDIGIDRKTKLPIPLVIDNINIKQSKFAYFTGQTETNYGNINNLSYMKSSIQVNNKLYFLIQYQGKLLFNNEETMSDVYLQKYYTQNNATLIFNTDLTETGLTYYNYMDNRGYNSSFNSTNIGFFNTKMKTDNIGNIYHFGYSKHTDNTWDNTDTYFDIQNSTNILNDKILRLGAAKNYNIGYLIKYNNNSINTAITYSGAITNLTYMNDIEIINNSNYVYVANNGDYYQSQNNNNRTLLYNGSNNKKSTILFKYNQNFDTIDWKILYHCILTSGEIGQILSTDKSLKIIKDTNEEYLYQTLSTPKGINKLKIEKDSIVDFYQYNTLYNNYNTFSIIKIDKNGNFIWLTPIYYSDFSGSTQIPELTNIIYDNDNLYLSINTNTALIINNIIYGENEINIKHYLIKMNKNGNIKWVNILGETNDTIGTDIKIYNNEYLYASGYFTNTTKISNYNLSTYGNIASYISKINIETGNIISVFDKYSTKTIKIKTLDLVDNNIYIGGDWIGGIFIGGIQYQNYNETIYSKIFIEQIKINSF